MFVTGCARLSPNGSPSFFQEIPKKISHVHAFKACDPCFDFFDLVHQFIEHKAMAERQFDLDGFE